MPREQASILTQSQRQYLIDGTTIGGSDRVSNPHEYNKGIRRRLSHSLEDLGLLFRELDGEELRKVFSEPFAPVKGLRDKDGEDQGWYCGECEEYVEAVNHDCEGDYSDSHWYATGPGAFAFLVWALNVNDEPMYPPYEEPQPAFDNFIEHAEIGIADYLTEKHNLTANVNVSIELSDVDRLDQLYSDDE